MPTVNWRLMVLCTAMLAAGVVAYVGTRYVLHRPMTEPAVEPDSASPDLKPYVGDWHSHTALLTVAADRTGTVDWRGYGPGCNGPDRCQGHANLRFTGDSAAGVVGSVVSSTREAEIRAGAGVTMQAHTDQTVTLIVAGRPEPLLFCGPDAAVGACGA